MKKAALCTFLILIVFTSCQKQEGITPKEEVTVEEPTLSIYNEWMVTGGTMYMENLETGVKTAYNHFDASKNVSSLRYGSVMFDIERIVVDSTIWEFEEAVGKFTLNQDTSKPYALSGSSEDVSIIEHPDATTQQMGGSARPVWIEEQYYSSGIILLHVQEAYENINGTNTKYYSVLELTKIN